MQAYIIFFTPSVPLRQLKVTLAQEGYENIVINHGSHALVLDTEQYGQEMATKISHILKVEYDEPGFVIVRSEVRLERLLQQEKATIGDCNPAKLYFLLLDRPPAPERIDLATDFIQSKRGQRLHFGPEGAYLCLEGENDQLPRVIQQISAKLGQPVLSLNREQVEQSIEMVRGHEARLEADF